MLRAVIIDDEPSGINTLKVLIGRHSAVIRCVASAVNAEEGIRLIEDFRPDVVFLDISMPEMSGFELLKKISFKEFELIFTTAHKEFAIQAIKSKAFDYLLKPIDDEDFNNCITAIRNKALPHGKASANSEEIIDIVVRDGIIYLRQKDIIRMEASGSYTYFYLEGGVKHLASKKIKEYEIHLNPDTFFRCHNSHIVNLKKVKKFVNHEGFFAQMSDDSIVDISRRNKEIFLERIKGL
jgi:two-component system, LytTR family, response regulator